MDSGSNMDTANGAGRFQLGPINGNCLEFWSPPETVENAHDQGTPQTYDSALNNNATPLASAPSANR